MRGWHKSDYRVTEWSFYWGTLYRNNVIFWKAAKLPKLRAVRSFSCHYIQFFYQSDAEKLMKTQTNNLRCSSLQLHLHQDLCSLCLVVHWPDLGGCGAQSLSDVVVVVVASH